MWVFIILDLFLSKRDGLKNLRFEMERISLQLLSFQYAFTAAATAFGRLVCSYINDLYL